MVFAVVVFLSALLLFQVQLIASKHLLPWFGGTPAVWTTSQMFFQVVLLAGYGYAHGLTKVKRPATQARIHLVVLFGATVLLGAFTIWAGEPLLAPEAIHLGSERPVLRLLSTLGVSVGLPFFVLSTTAPLVQYWHSRQREALDRTYRLYALSNVGSFIGLLSYPVLVERQLDLTQQAWAWAGLFVVFVAGCGAIALRTATRPLSSPATSLRDQVPQEVTGSSPTGDVGFIRMALWLVLSASGSVAFLATTNQITHDVAAVPFLWAVPLALYLLTFIICFDRPAWYSPSSMAIAAAVTGIAIIPNIVGALGAASQIALYCAFLVTFCMLCHGELVRLRPGADHLTLFYLLVALGGAIGGVFVSLVAPALFSDFRELQLIIPVGFAAVAVAWSLDRRSPLFTGNRSLFASVVTTVLLVVIRYPIERTRIGRYDWIASRGWTVTLIGSMVVAASLCVVLWRRPIARWPLWPRAFILLAVVCLGVLQLQGPTRARHDLLYAARNFYGVVRVESMTTEAADVRRFLHGTTLHGVQVDMLGRNVGATAYYSPSTGIAAASTDMVREAGDAASERRCVHFGVVGMGVGTMTAFSLACDRVSYYEINPEVIAVAQGPYFSFLRNAAGAVTVIEGDARLSLERQLRDGAPQRFDLLAIDAFSSDSVPVHLITVEAFRLYASHLNTNASILAVNVTNRYLDLEPVVAAHARALGFHGVLVESDGDPPIAVGSSWILMSRDPGITTDPALLRIGARPLRQDAVSFTDRYSNLFRVLR